MLVDSHCHLNFEEIYNDIDLYMAQMAENKVSHALCVGTRLDNLDVVALTHNYNNVFASVGVHPDENMGSKKVNKRDLFKYIHEPKVIAIGETGLDYYRIKDQDMSWQHERFILHIEVAKEADLPLIIHTRESIADTLAIMREYEAQEVGAVMHCFTEDIESARKCLDMGFYISISGIVTFKNARAVQEVARYVPLDRLLIETDAPFLAPVPFRGKLNHPALIKYTAQYMADLRSMSLDELAKATTNNFFNLFKKAITT